MRESLPFSCLAFTNSYLALALVVGGVFAAVPPARALDPKKTAVVKANNEGVNLLKKNDFDGAAARFKEALTLDPGYSLARDNLAITYNNRGIKSDNDRDSLKYFHLSIWLSNGKNASTETNLSVVRGRLYKDTKSFEGIVNIARDCLKHDDKVGAIWEYKRALELKKDDAVAAELNKIQLPSSLKRILDATEHGTETASPKPSDRPEDVDFGPYMTALQRRIKRHWFPPKGSESRHVVAVFKVNRNGEISNVKLTNSGGKKCDEAALSALRKAPPFDKLPKGSPEIVDIQFTFDYNVFKDGKKVATKDGARQDEADDRTQDTTRDKASAADHEKGTGGGSLNYPDAGQKAQSNESSPSASPDSSQSSSKCERTNLSDILKWVIPGTIGFFVIGAVIALLMSKQRD